MSKEIRILFPTEFGPLGEKAESNAIHLAEKFDAELVLMHAFNVPTGLSRLFSDVSEEEIRKRAQSHIDEYAASLRKKTSVSISTLVKHHSRPEVAIVETAKDIDARIIIFGTKGGSGLRDALLGSAVNYVIRHTSCPVVTMRNEPEYGGFKRILLPMDLAQESGEKLGWGVQLALKFGAALYIHGVVSGSASDQMRLQERVKWSKDYATKHGLTDIHVTFEESSSSISDTILSYADRVDADLICVMTQAESESGLKTTVLGSVADHLVNHSQRPIMSIRPERHYSGRSFSSPLFT